MNLRDFVFPALLATSLVCLGVGVTIPILVVHKQAHANVLGVKFRLLDQTNRVSVIGGIRELWPKNVVLAILIAAASIVLPLVKHILLGMEWLRCICSRRHASAIRVMSSMARWSLIEPLAIALMIVVAKLGDQLDVRAGPGIAPYLTSIGLILLMSIHQHPSTRT